MAANSDVDSPSAPPSPRSESLSGASLLTAGSATVTCQPSSSEASGSATATCQPSSSEASGSDYSISVRPIGSGKAKVDPELKDVCELPDGVESLPQFYVHDDNILEQSLLSVKNNLRLCEIKDVEHCRYLRVPNGETHFCSDGALNPSRAGFGVVGIDSEGEVVAVSAKLSEDLSFIQHHELEGVNEALDLAAEHFEGRSNRVITVSADSADTLCSLHEQFVISECEEDDNGKTWQKVKTETPGQMKFNNLCAEIIRKYKLRWVNKCTFRPIKREINFPSDFLSRIVVKRSGNIRLSDKASVERSWFYPTLSILMKRTLRGSFLSFGGTYGFVKAKRLKMEQMRSLMNS